MVNWADPIRRPLEPEQLQRKHVFTFINDNYGRTWEITAPNVGDAWTILADHEETARHELVEVGWRVKFA